MVHCKFHTLFEDAFIEECEILRADSLENDLDVLGEFATEETMRDQWGWSETGSISIVFILAFLNTTGIFLVISWNNDGMPNLGWFNLQWFTSNSPVT